MPCYSEPPSDREIARWWKEAKQEKDWRRWYQLTPKDVIEQWLCDALRGSPPSKDALKWHELHKKYHDKE